MTLNLSLALHCGKALNFRIPLFNRRRMCCLDDVRMRMRFIPYRKAFSHNLVSYTDFIALVPPDKQSVGDGETGLF